MRCKKIAGAFLCLLANTLAFCQGSNKQIQNILAAQASAWNHGDITQYMQAGYWQSDSLVFIGKDGPTYGYQPTLQRYLKAYPDAAHMGQLTLKVAAIKDLSPGYCFVIGSWALQRSAGNISGSFTLLFHKINSQWRIIVDHSS